MVVWVPVPASDSTATANMPVFTIIGYMVRAHSIWHRVFCMSLVIVYLSLSLRFFISFVSGSSYCPECRFFVVVPGRAANNGTFRSKNTTDGVLVTFLFTFSDVR